MLRNLVNALETARLSVHHYGWYCMPASIYKLLIHGQAIIENFSIPIGQLSKEASEARNKAFRKYREMHSPKINRIATNEDILHHFLCHLLIVISKAKSE